MDSIFLIEEGWIDPMENRNADGYKPFGFKLTEQEAKDFCESRGYWTADDCWSIDHKPNGKMWKYRYTEIYRVKEVINAQEAEYDEIVEPEKIAMLKDPEYFPFTGNLDVTDNWDDAYNSYLNGGNISWLKPVIVETPIGKMSIPIPYTKKEFIDKCETDLEFGEKWGNLVNTATSNIETTKTDGTKPSLLSYDELEDIKRRYTPAQIKEMWEHAQPKIRFAIYEKIPRHGREPNGLILGPFDTEDLAKEAGEKWGYSGDNYFIDLYRD